MSRMALVSSGAFVITEVVSVATAPTVARSGFAEITVDPKSARAEIIEAPLESSTDMSRSQNLEQPFDVIFIAKNMGRYPYGVSPYADKNPGFPE